MSSEHQQMWERVLGGVETELPRASFSTWFKNTWVIKQEDGVVHVGVPNEFVKDWVSTKYHKLILRFLREENEGIRAIEYIIARNEQKQEGGLSQKKEEQAGKLPLHELYVDKTNNLNPRYTFDSFVVGSFNELAHAAAQAVLKNLGKLYNPLFIHGGTGLGKTHLIQSIGNAVKKEQEGCKIIYLSSEKFAVELVNAIPKGRVNDFKEKYRAYDVFIMDDIQFFSNKDKTQEELFHLFNDLYENNKQIIFSSDRHPHFIQGIEDRLKSRFGAGMVVDIGRPDYESRYAILKHKTQAYNMALSEAILNHIATSFDGSVRDLEGILNTLLCKTQLKNSDLTLEDAKQVLKNSSRPKKNKSPQDVVKTVASFYNIEEKDVYKKTRRKEIVRPRQIIMFLLREDFDISYPVIGEKLGGRDHTTVIHSCEKIRNDLETDSLLEQELDQIRSVI